MEFYKLIYDYANDTQATLVNINENTLGFDRYDVNTETKLDVEKIYCTIVEENLFNYDSIANNLSWLIVSDNVRKMMLNANLGIYEFIPVVNKNDENVVVGYLFHCLNVLDALDEKKSLCSRRKYVINGKDCESLAIIKYAVDSVKIGDIDIFKLKQSTIPCFVSQYLKDILVKGDAKGFEFLKIKS